ncbi:putative granule-bound starch synthase 1, chloroplastic/amyloplastic [Monoraphidium neglectum]|uniref:Putative granule-bound starch synthase 1, chloroplastic/amyloplastic n=1 Tax=Monoraphidium neglectum TaxID=145388 RepID=A0A0D2L5N4_9CHLO|nr:putative granule-bound starch synthase 1, chloroplastic/amyloplastic [Monoraphidium neglectum]KIZ02334.1 putative granule-bound starch synthase 1, chloroplastic/amyloplastic [Monoraphidium neglectum]|eukprot:XP_013901353.1 putative granule-bound starch synthase 1, chloroplastic/amyloplastic [Monoraphidium neglectum]
MQLHKMARGARLSASAQRAGIGARRVAVRSVASVAPSADVELAANPLSIAFVAAEVAPWSKTGGLGDVVGGLPIELAKRGHKVITIAPRWVRHAGQSGACCDVQAGDHGPPRYVV